VPLKVLPRLPEAQHIQREASHAPVGLRVERLAEGALEVDEGELWPPHLHLVIELSEAVFAVWVHLR